MASTQEIKEFIESFVQLKFVHERIIVVAKDQLEERLDSEINKINTLTTEIEYETPDGFELGLKVCIDSIREVVSGAYTFPESSQKIAKLISERGGEEAFVLVHHPLATQQSNVNKYQFF